MVDDNVDDLDDYNYSSSLEVDVNTVMVAAESEEVEEA